MKRLIATKEVWYGGKKHVEGDEFDCNDLEAKILTAHDVGGGARAKYKTTAIMAEEPPPQVAEPAEAAEPESAETESPSNPTRRRYRRRDMTAEKP